MACKRCGVPSYQWCDMNACPNRNRKPVKKPSPSTPSHPRSKAMADSVEKVIAEMRDYLAWTKPAALVIHELADRLEALSGSGEAVKPCKLVLTSPERIYLQISEDEGHYDEEFPKSPHGDEVTWCQEPTLDCEVEYVRADLAAPQGAGSVPEGWKLVPVEPTEAMLDAAGPQCHANRPYPQDNHCGPRAMRTTEYRAMLAAAPEYKQ